MDCLQKLEYTKILAKLSSYCHMESSKNIANGLKPISDINKIKEKLAETTEAVNLLHRCSMPPNIEFSEDKNAVIVLETYGVLSLESILNFTKILKICEELKKYFNKDFLNQEEFPKLKPIFEKLYTNKGIIEQIGKSVIDEYNLDDNASKQLSNIRKKQSNLEQEIKQKLTNMIHSANYSKYIQENVITIRNERYVIPVKEEYRTQIKGFVHDISSTGATVFIEPITIFELNNQIRNLKVEENIEIEKIIKELTKLFYPYIEELKSDIELLINLDFIFAKAKYSKDIKANEPKINENKQIILHEARHPLIEANKVIPISLTLGIDYETLLITGPNTGGKTVTLKTVGLLTCMACSGLHIPANSTSSIGIFNKIFADIGDDQSIVDSLSTFSAHMKNLVEIVEKSDENTLVLVDELGSGTDPIEGQALAISILEYLKEKQAVTIATTHYQELKKYAMITKGFKNASVEFDVETLTPTYHLLIGVPGKSNAFEISKKLGLREEIINKSKERLDNKDVVFEELMKQIYNDKIQIEKRRVETEENLKEVQKLKESLQHDVNERFEKEQEKIANAKIEARNILLKAKEEANSIIKNMREIEKSQEDEYNYKNGTNFKNRFSEKNRELNNLRNKLNRNISQFNENKKNDGNCKYNEQINYNGNRVDKEKLEEIKSKIKLNTEVYVKSLGQNGIVVSNISKENEVFVQIGNIKINVHISELQVIKGNVKNSTVLKQRNIVNIHTHLNKTKVAKTEINVIGLNVEEARFVVEKFIDDSIIAKLQTVRIIHGKGTGKLRQGIHQILDKNPHVKTYRMGTFGEGELGVTVVELLI